MTYDEFIEFIEKHHNLIKGFIGDGFSTAVTEVYKGNNGWKIRYSDEKETRTYSADEIFNAYDNIVFELNSLVEIKKTEYFKIQGIYQTDEIEYIKSALKTLADLEFDKGSLIESREISNLLEKIEDNITKEE